MVLVEMVVLSLIRIKEHEKEGVCKRPVGLYKAVPLNLSSRESNLT